MFVLALNTMAALFLCMLIGYIAARKKVITEQMIDGLNIFLLNITFPIMTLGVFNVELTDTIINVGPKMFMYGVLFNLILILLSYVLVYVLKVNDQKRGVLMACFIFTNGGFIGFPLILSLMGANGLLEATILNIPFNIICFSYGIYILQPKGENNISIKSILLSPVMVGVWIGMGLLLSQFIIPGTFEVDGVATRLPAPLTKTINMVGSITSPLAMIIVGAGLEKTKLKKVFTNTTLHLFAIARVVIAPFICYLFFNMIIDDQMILVIVVVFTGLPTAAVVPVLAERLKQDYVFASEAVLISTLYSLITIPLIFYFLT